MSLEVNRDIVRIYSKAINKIIPYNYNELLRKLSIPNTNDTLYEVLSNKYKRLFFELHTDNRVLVHFFIKDVIRIFKPNCPNISTVNFYEYVIAKNQDTYHIYFPHIVMHFLTMYSFVVFLISTNEKYRDIVNVSLYKGNKNIIRFVNQIDNGNMFEFINRTSSIKSTIITVFHHDQYIKPYVKIPNDIYEKCRKELEPKWVKEQLEQYTKIPNDIYEKQQEKTSEKVSIESLKNELEQEEEITRDAINEDKYEELYMNAKIAYEVSMNDVYKNKLYEVMQYYERNNTLKGFKGFNMVNLEKYIKRLDS